MAPVPAVADMVRSSMAIDEDSHPVGERHQCRRPWRSLVPGILLCAVTPVLPADWRSLLLLYGRVFAGLSPWVLAAVALGISITLTRSDGHTGLTAPDLTADPTQ
jgi:hypothetical protein